MIKQLKRLSILALTTAVTAIPMVGTAFASTPVGTAPTLAIGYRADNGAGQVTVNDKPVMVLHGTTNPSGVAQLARQVALRLNELQQSRQLRADQVTPAVSNGKYEVRVGKTTVLVIDNALAKAERVPAALVAMRMTNQLRRALGGEPYENQASRGLMSGGRSLSGEATWYGEEFNGRPTTSGERYDVRLMTAAHRTLPFGTLVLVTHATNGRSVLVKINDRGPWTNQTRILDLTPTAYRLLAPLNSGVIPIRAEVVSIPSR
ncbi:MAG: septal ring lytic transglycosylase RlpA family protein [Candidatus Sericytochromatia bacterium]|nr:septal ring lytic transglycosylase RlpA family protein [Candidatus Sericytochromatia bacterium]